MPPPPPPPPPRGKERRPRCTQREEGRTSFTDLRKLDSTELSKKWGISHTFSSVFFSSGHCDVPRRTEQGKKKVLSSPFSYLGPRCGLEISIQPPSLPEVKEGGGNGLFKEKKSFLSETDVFSLFLSFAQQ